MIAAAFSQAEARDPQHQRTWVVLVDGAGHQLDLIRAEAARRGVTIHIVIDLIHVLEYIWKAAWSLHPAGDPAAEDWVAVKALAVLAGDSARAAAEITAEADAAGLTAAQRTGADACVRYLTSVRCPLLRVDPAQMPRLEEIHANLGDRLQEAKDQGWLGEVTAIETTLAAAAHKLRAMRDLTARNTTVHLGTPEVRSAAGRSSPGGC